MSRQFIIQELAQTLECPVCFEFPQRPIFTCVVGHHVCVRCHSMLNHCPLCRSEFRGTRSFIAEASISAINKLLGLCDSPLRGAPTNGRLLSVPGNPIRCCLAVNGCRNRVMDASSYIDHLKQKHAVLVITSASGKCVHKVSVSSRGNVFVKRGRERLFILEVSQKTFVINMFQEGGLIQVWAETEVQTMDTQKYKARLSIQTTAKQKISWTGDINGHHVTDKSVSITGTCFTITAAQLKDCLKEDVDWTRFWTLEVQLYYSTRERVLGPAIRMLKEKLFQLYDSTQRTVSVLSPGRFLNFLDHLASYQSVVEVIVFLLLILISLIVMCIVQDTLGSL